MYKTVVHTILICDVLSLTFLMTKRERRRARVISAVHRYATSRRLAASASTDQQRQRANTERRQRASHWRVGPLTRVQDIGRCTSFERRGLLHLVGHLYSVPTVREEAMPLVPDHERAATVSSFLNQFSLCARPRAAKHFPVRSKFG